MLKFISAINNKPNKYMASGINQKYDKIWSNQGTEWHRVAIPVEKITKELVKPSLFPIIQSPANVIVDGNNIQLDKYKVLCADYRGIRDDLEENELILPLHIPKSGYQVIENEKVWDMMEKTIKDLGAVITSVGTLEAGKKFFVSVSFEDSDVIINKDQYKFYLNFVTSHDGTITLFVYDSAMRIVCMNTLRASMSDRNTGDLQLRIAHKKNADLAINNLPEVVNSILIGRTKFKEVMEYLADCKVDQNEAIAMTAGYFSADEKNKLSRQGYNATCEIATLFTRGIACNGETLYDLSNAATQYWTSGLGTGLKDTNDFTRTYRSAMGSASDHKCDFVSMLSDEKMRKSYTDIGRESWKKFITDEKNSQKLTLV
jgi:hypothetical protein